MDGEEIQRQHRHAPAGDARGRAVIAPKGIELVLDDLANIACRVGFRPRRPKQKAGPGHDGCNGKDKMAGAHRPGSPSP